MVLGSGERDVKEHALFILTFLPLTVWQEISPKHDDGFVLQPLRRMDRLELHTVLGDLLARFPVTPGCLARDAGFVVD